MRVQPVDAQLCRGTGHQLSFSWSLKMPVCPHHAGLCGGLQGGLQVSPAHLWYLFLLCSLIDGLCPAETLKGHS